jgi:hypothetical protein
MRERQAEPRFDHRGGVNTTFSEEVLDANELRSCKNGRILFGDIEKRTGTQRIHDTVIASSGLVRGVYQWDAPLGKQVVAVGAGNFYHKLAAATDFTAIASSLSTTRNPSFAPYRSGAVIKLIFADGSLRSWDGTTLTTAITGAPDARMICVYKLRMMAIDGTKTLHGSKVGDPTLWGVANDGFFADVETYDAEPITGIVTVGSSLLLMKEDNIARFTGVDTEDIRIDIESEGVSAEVGLIAPGTLCRFEEIAFILSDRGPYLVSESGVQETGLKVARQFDFANRAYWQDAIAVHHRGRKEVWLSIPAAGETTNATTWIYNYRTQSWGGPFIFPFSLQSAARLERTTGDESVIGGGTLGWVRELDITSTVAKDDLLRDSTGGTNVELDIEFPPLIGGNPDVIKSLRSKQKVEADLKAAGSLEAYCSSELLPGGTSVVMPTKGAGMKNYLYRFNSAKGARIVRGLREATAEIVRIGGIIQNFSLGRKAR